MRSLNKLMVLVILASLASACEPPEPTAPLTVQTGTVADYKISGHHYLAEVTEAKDGYVLWVFSRNKTPVFKVKTYRGLFSVYSEEEGFKTWSKFDPKILDTFFPLTEGKEITFGGRRFTRNIEEGYPFFVTISVREKTEITVKETVYPVYILDYSVIEEHPEGSRTYTQTAWYSDLLEASLRTDFKWASGTFSMRMLSLEMGEGNLDEDNEPEGLGTTRL